jgi:single-strand DNA-binding protein
MHLHTTLIGHIGRDAETRTLQGGRVVTSFSVAHTESWKDSRGEKQERTTWVNCSYFTADHPAVSQYLMKGALICVTGKVSARAYLDARNEPAASLDLNVQDIRLLGSKKREEESNQNVPGYPGNVPPPPAKQPETFTTTPEPVSGDDLPF